MLRVYTRHYPPCPQGDGNHRRCHCPKWINGTLPTGKFVRVSAKTRSWENAERKARIMEVNADPLRPLRPDVSLRITVEEAVRDFLSDEEARQLAKTTTCQSKTLFQKQLLNWAKGESLNFIDELTTVRLREFRASWKNASLTTQRKHHRLNGFFDFCIENEWLHKNTSKKMKPVQVSPDPTDYFTPSEMEKIIDGTYAYGEWRGGRDFEHRATRPRALILLMRWSGLSILDAVTLERRRLHDDRLLLYRHKTKVPVYAVEPLIYERSVKKRNRCMPQVSCTSSLVYGGKTNMNTFGYYKCPGHGTLCLICLMLASMAGCSKSTLRETATNGRRGRGGGAEGCSDLRPMDRNLGRIRKRQC
jgi:integrase/recombinase XerD